MGAFAANLRSFEFLRDFTTSATLTGSIDIPFALIFVAVIAWISPVMLLPILFGIALLLVITMVVRPRLERLTETKLRSWRPTQRDTDRDFVGPGDAKGNGC